MQGLHTLLIVTVHWYTQAVSCVLVTVHSFVYCIIHYSLLKSIAFNVFNVQYIEVGIIFEPQVAS